LIKGDILSKYKCLVCTTDSLEN